MRYAKAHRHVEDFLGQFHSAFHLGGAAGQDDAGRHQILVAAATQLGLDQGEELVVTGLHHLGKAWRDSSRGGRSPTLGTLMVSPAPASLAKAQA